MVILDFSYVVSDASRKLPIKFFVANLLNKIKSSIGCWQNFKCSRLSMLYPVPCNDELIRDTKKYTPPKRGRRNVSCAWILWKLFHNEWHGVTIPQVML